MSLAGTVPCAHCGSRSGGGGGCVAERAPRDSKVEQCPDELMLVSLHPAHIAAATAAIIGTMLFHPQQ